jgi:hypothetical protein
MILSSFLLLLLSYGKYVCKQRDATTTSPKTRGTENQMTPRQSRDNNNSISRFPPSKKGVMKRLVRINFVESIRLISNSSGKIKIPIEKIAIRMEDGNVWYTTCSAHESSSMDEDETGIIGPFNKYE